MTTCLFFMFWTKNTVSHTMECSTQYFNTVLLFAIQYDEFALPVVR